MENTVTFTEKTNAVKDDTISIRPYFNPDIENMGLEKYNMALHEGVKHTESVTCLERNGIRRYITGLNEFAPEIKKLSPEARKEKVNEIRQVVCQLEKELATNIIDIKDTEKSFITSLLGLIAKKNPVIIFFTTRNIAPK